jgi:hypothetical protein
MYVRMYVFVCLSLCHSVTLSLCIDLDYLFSLVVANRRLLEKAQIIREIS